MTCRPLFAIAFWAVLIQNIFIFTFFSDGVSEKPSALFRSAKAVLHDLRLAFAAFQRIFPYG